VIIQAFIIASIHAMLFKRFQIIGLAYLFAAAQVVVLSDLIILTYWLLSIELLSSMLEVAE
jgi:hypothetical protein